MSCSFPAIPPDLLDDIIIYGTLELRYSLVAASVPGLSNLHLMPQFEIEFVYDPVITPFTETLSYLPGSNEAIVILVSTYISSISYMYMHNISYIYTCIFSKLICS